VPAGRERVPEDVPVTELAETTPLRLPPRPDVTDAGAMASAPEPASTPDEISAEELAALREQGEPVQLVDVREPWEAEAAAIDGSVLIPLGQLPQRWSELDPSTRTVVMCHGGVRSAQGRDILRSLDFESVTSLAGGIDAWSRRVDPTVPRY
jgi:adenylyltransferase/sulfurtransferase